MERWVVTAKRADFQAIGKRFRIDPVTARIIRNRDVTGQEAIEQYLHGGLEDLYDPWLMKDMKKSVDRILLAVKEKKKIRIIGDYDIDGVMSTYILLTGLSRIGAVVDTYIPDRVQDGYGMHEHLVRRAFEDHIDVIVTCDNGIAAYKEISLAKELGMQVLVTDHHNIPYEEGEDGSRVSILPPADAVVNPKQEDCCYPFQELCGAAVAYKLVTALYQKCGIDHTEHEKMLELVAIATVGDVMDLLGENRILVKEGLKRLQNPVNPGIRALVEATGLSDKEINAYHIGFVLGPCINASGRLDTAQRSLALLKASDRMEAARLAGDLVAMNESRKAMTADGVEQAVNVLETSGLQNDRVLVVYLPNCHESLAGIIAGRIRERYYKPVFVLTKGEKGVKGSGRSIEAYSMYDELTKCKDLLTQFGGHPMAAGLSMPEEHVEAFRRKINEVCTLTQQELIPKVTIDVPVPLAYVKPSLVQELQMLEPFGKGNPRPLFAQKNVQILSPRVVGKNRNVVQMKVMDETGMVWSAVYFGDGDIFCKFVKKKEIISIVYYPQIHVWQGVESLRITIQNYQ